MTLRALEKNDVRALAGNRTRDLSVTIVTDLRVLEWGLGILSGCDGIRNYGVEALGGAKDCYVSTTTNIPPVWPLGVGCRLSGNTGSEESGQMYQGKYQYARR